MRLARPLAVVLGAGSLAVAPTFRPASGWIVVRPGGPQPASSVVAVTAGDRAVVHPFAPFAGFKRLRPRGIVFWVTILGRRGTVSGFARLRWPLRLASFRVDRGWEGQPTPNIQQRLQFGVARGWNLDARVYFATQHPDKKLLAKPQAELDRLRLPTT